MVGFVYQGGSGIRGVSVKAEGLLFGLGLVSVISAGIFEVGVARVCDGVCRRCFDRCLNWTCATAFFG